MLPVPARTREAVEGGFARFVSRQGTLGRVLTEPSRTLDGTGQHLAIARELAQALQAEQLQEDRGRSVEEW